jgi:hypothetical protein
MGASNRLQTSHGPVRIRARNRLHTEPTDRPQLPGAVFIPFPRSSMPLKGLINILAFTAATIFFFSLAGYANAAGISVFVTAYNAEPGQTDDEPCTGASGRNLCVAAKEGDRTIALSRDLLWYRGGPFRWHYKVRLVSGIPQCNGVYSVEDTLNKRFRQRADLFFLDRKDNTSCRATVEKIVYR